MAGNSSGPVTLTQLGTWRSGGESPSFPGAGDARRLLASVGRTPYGPGCTLVRVRLANSDRRTLVRVRERLLGEDPIVGTSIGRDAGPDDPGAFDILVVPDCDPVTVGHEIADVDDVVGVAATAFERPDRPGSQPEEGSDQEDSASVDVSAVDEAFAELKAADEGTPLVELVDDGDRGQYERDERTGRPVGRTNGDGGTAAAPFTTTPGVGGLDALEEADDGPPDPGTADADASDGASAATGSVDDGKESEVGEPASGLPVADDDRRSGLGRRTNGNRQVDTTAGNGPGVGGIDRSTPGRNGRPYPGGRSLADRQAAFLERLERLDERVTDLESAFDDEWRGRGPDRPESGGDAFPAELEDRLASLEATVAKLERWRRQVEGAATDESSRSG